MSEGRLGFIADGNFWLGVLLATLFWLALGVVAAKWGLEAHDVLVAEAVADSEDDWRECNEELARLLAEMKAEARAGGE